ncbi:MAG TPA: hypothetical protein VGC26_11385 [Afipia sp.]
MTVVRRIALLLVVAFIAVVFGTFAINYYHARKAASEPPPIIFERTDRPSKV